MSIAQLKINTIIESVIKERFKEGKFPEAQQIITDIYNKLKDEDLYMPVYSFQPIEYEEKTNSSMYNRMLDEIEIDLHILYHTAMNLSKSMTDHIIRQSVEHEQLKNELTNLKNELKTKILSYSRKGILTTFYDDFIDMQKINMSRTTANVDLVAHEARISTVSNAIDKLSFKASNIYIHGELQELPSTYIDSIEETGKLLNILSDAANQKWGLKIVSNTNASINYTIYLQLINLTQIKFINNMKLFLNSLKYTNILIQTGSLLNNGKYEWIDLPGYDIEKINDLFSYDLYLDNQTPIFKIILNKQEADEILVDGTKTKYIYRFGIDNISLYGKKYNQESTLVSKPFNIKGFNYGKASLAVDEYIQDGTDIEYYLSLNNQEPIDWIRISPSHYNNPSYKQYLDFNNLKHNSINFKIESESSTKNLILPSLRTNGLDFYMLGALPTEHKLVKDTEQLFVGANSWLVKSVETTLNDIPDKETFSSVFAKSKNASYVKTDHSLYLDIPDLPNEAQLYKIVTNINCPSSKNYTISLMKNEVKYLFILNNENITGQYNQIDSIGLSQGMNNIILYVYKPEGCNNIYINLGIILEEGSIILANEEPMKKVSIFDLQNRIAATSQKEYAIHTIEDEYIIVLNHIAKDLDYIFEYDFTVKEINNILFKAVLLNNKTNMNITPVLKRYAINIIN